MTSPCLEKPPRSRTNARADLAEAALRELLACVELGLSEDRYQAAKAKAHRALDQIATLREGGW